MNEDNDKLGNMTSKSRSSMKAEDDLQDESEINLDPSAPQIQAPLEWSDSTGRQNIAPRSAPSSSRPDARVILPSTISQPNLSHDGVLKTGIVNESKSSACCNTFIDDSETNNVLRFATSSAILDFLFETNNLCNKPEEELVKDDDGNFLSGVAETAVEAVKSAMSVALDFMFENEASNICDGNCNQGVTDCPPDQGMNEINQRLPQDEGLDEMYQDGLEDNIFLPQTYSRKSLHDAFSQSDFEEDQSGLRSFSSNVDDPSMNDGMLEKDELPRPASSEPEEYWLPGEDVDIIEDQPESSKLEHNSGLLPNFSTIRILHQDGTEEHIALPSEPESASASESTSKTAVEIALDPVLDDNNGLQINPYNSKDYNEVQNTSILSVAGSSASESASKTAVEIALDPVLEDNYGLHVDSYHSDNFNKASNTSILSATSPDLRPSVDNLMSVESLVAYLDDPRTLDSRLQSLNHKECLQKLEDIQKLCTYLSEHPMLDKEYGGSGGTEDLLQSGGLLGLEQQHESAYLAHENDANELPPGLSDVEELETLKPGRTDEESSNEVDQNAATLTLNSDQIELPVNRSSPRSTIPELSPCISEDPGTGTIMQGLLKPYNQHFKDLDTHGKPLLGALDTGLLPNLMFHSNDKSGQYPEDQSSIEPGLSMSVGLEQPFDDKDVKNLSIAIDVSKTNLPTANLSQTEQISQSTSSEILPGEIPETTSASDLGLNQEKLKENSDKQEQASDSSSQTQTQSEQPLKVVSPTSINSLGTFNDKDAKKLPSEAPAPTQGYQLSQPGVSSLTAINSPNQKETKHLQPDSSPRPQSQNSSQPARVSSPTSINSAPTFYHRETKHLQADSFSQPQAQISPHLARTSSPTSVISPQTVHHKDTKHIPSEAPPQTQEPQNSQQPNRVSSPTAINSPQTFHHKDTKHLQPDSSRQPQSQISPHPARVSSPTSVNSAPTFQHRETKHLPDSSSQPQSQISPHSARVSSPTSVNAPHTLHHKDTKHLPSEIPPRTQGQQPSQPGRVSSPLAINSQQTFHHKDTKHLPSDKSSSGGGSAKGAEPRDYTLQETIINYMEEEIPLKDFLVEQTNINPKVKTLLGNYGDLQCILTEIKIDSATEPERTLEINGNTIPISKNVSSTFLKNEIETLQGNKKNIKDILDHLKSLMSQPGIPEIQPASTINSATTFVTTEKTSVIFMKEEIPTEVWKNSSKSEYSNSTTNSERLQLEVLQAQDTISQKSLNILEMDGHRVCLETQPAMAEDIGRIHDVQRSLVTVADDLLVKSNLRQTSNKTDIKSNEPMVESDFDIGKGNSFPMMLYECAKYLDDSGEKFQNDEDKQLEDKFRESFEVQFSQVVNQNAFNELGYSFAKAECTRLDLEESFEANQLKNHNTKYSSRYGNGTDGFYDSDINLKTLEQLGEDRSKHLFDNTESKSKVLEWLEQIPSSPEPPVSDIVDSEELINFHVNKSSQVSELPTMSSSSSEDNLKELALGHYSPVKFTSIPAPKLASSELSSILELADSKIPEINRKIASNPFSQPASFISGSAVWKRSTEKPKTNKTTPGWLSPRKFITWFASLSLFQWFSKKKDTTGNKNILEVETPNPLLESLSLQDPNQPAAFTPFQTIVTADGQLLPSKLLFAGDNLQEQVKSAVDAINDKLDDIQISQVSNPNKGFSDGEAFRSLDEKPSMDEIELLTDLIKNKEPSKDNKMRSIFGIREYNRIDQTPYPDLFMIGTPEQDPQDQRRSIWQRIVSIFVPSYQQNRINSHRIRRRRRRRQHSTIQNAQLHELINQQLQNQIVQNADIVQEQEPQHPRQRSTIRNFVSNVGSGLMNLFGLRRHRRVAPEPLPVPVPEPVEQQQNLGRRNHNRSGNVGEMRQVLLGNGSTTRRARNPLRQRLAREALSDNMYGASQLENKSARSKVSSPN